MNHAHPLRVVICAVLASFCLVAIPPATGQADEVIVVDSLAQLAEYASQSNVNVRLQPGEYRIDDGSLSQLIDVPTFHDGKPSGKTKPIVTQFNFSGNRSHYDLTDTQIIFNTEVQTLKDYYKRDHLKVFVSGHGNTIEGLTLHDEGDGVPISGATMVVIIGNKNTLSNADLFVHGSSPYGYGHLLGKGRGALAKLQKQCGILVSGKNTKLIGCKVLQYAFGHGIFMQGAVDTLIQDCYIEGELRPTDDMLAETSGPAFNAGFKSAYPPGKIMPGQIKALAEDGIRTYSTGSMVPTGTGPVTVVNCTIKNMRAGVCLGFEQGVSKIIDTTTIGHQERGFSIGTDGIIENSKGDAMHGPLLTFLGPSKKNATIDLQIINTVSQYPVPRVLEINGTGHTIRLRNFEDQPRPDDTPIVFGGSDWEDIKYWRAPDSKRSQYSGAYNCRVRNETGLPIVFTDLTKNNQLLTNGEVVEDKGQGNIVKQRK